MDRKVLEQLMTRAMRAFSLKDYASAQQYAKDVIRKAPHASSPHILLGTIYGNQGNYQKAIASFLKARELRPRNIESLNNLGVMYRFAGELDKAEEALKEAAKVAKRRPDIYYNLGNVYKQRGDFPEALAAYEQALELDPDFVLAYNNMGTLYEQRGDFESALGVYERGLSADPNHPTILYNRGVVLQHLKRLEEAEEAFEKAVIQRPGWVDALNNLGVTRQMMEKLDDAEEVFQEILKADPDNPRARNNLATTYARQGRHEEAIDLLKRALAASPEYDRAAVNLGKLLEQTDPEGDAAEEIEALYRARPENAELAYQYSQSLRKKGDYEEAKRVLNPFTSTGTQTPEIDFLLGIIALKQDREGNAEDFFFRARKKMRESAALAEHSNPILLEAKAWHEGGLSDRGCETLEEYLKEHPEDLPVRKLLADMLMSIRQDEKALVVLQNLKHDKPEDTEVLSMLARCYQRLGHKSEALETVDELVSVQGQRATSDDLNALNKSLELYEQAVAAYQSEHGDAWEKSLDSLGRLNTAAQSEELLGAESFEAMEEDTIPVLEFGDQESFLDQDFLRDEEGLREDLVEDLEEEEQDSSFAGSSSDSGSGDSPHSPSSGREGQEPSIPQQPLTDMIEDPKNPFEDDYEIPPVRRQPEQPQQAYEPPPQQPQSWPQYPPPQTPMQPQMPQYPAQVPQPMQPQMPQYPPQYPAQAAQPEAPQAQQGRQQALPQEASPQVQSLPEQAMQAGPQQPDPPRQEPYPQDFPPQMPQYPPTYPPPRQPEPTYESDGLEDLDLLDIPEGSLLPEDARIHLEDDFLPADPLAIDGEAEPDETLNEGHLEPFDPEALEDEDPELEQVDAVAASEDLDEESYGALPDRDDEEIPMGLEEDEFSPGDDPWSEEMLPEDAREESLEENGEAGLAMPDDLETGDSGSPLEDFEDSLALNEALEDSGPSDEGIGDLGDSVPSDEAHGGLDDSGLLEEELEDLDDSASLDAGLEDLAKPEDGVGFTAEEEMSEFREEQAQSPARPREVVPGVRPVPARSVRASQVVPVAETRRREKAPVPPEKSLGLIDYLMDLTRELPPEVNRDFVESGTAQKMKSVREKLAGLLEQDQRPAPPPRPAPPMSPAPGNGEGIGKAFALIADLSKVLPDEQGDLIRNRMRRIYERMKEIRERDGLST